MATLSDRHRAFIVRRLAMFEGPSEVVETVKEEFGLEVDRRQVHYYDPNTQQGAAQLAEKWKEMFRETRERFREETESIAVANKAYRLKRLDTMARKAMDMGNYPLAADLLKQAAEDSGGKYTNRQELTGKGGGPIETESAVKIYLPDNGRTPDD